MSPEEIEVGIENNIRKLGRLIHKLPRNGRQGYLDDISEFVKQMYDKYEAV